MASVQVNLRSEGFRKFDWFFLPLGLIVGAAMIILAVRHWERTGWISVLAGVLLIVQAMVNWRNHRPLRSTWDDTGIRGMVGPGKRISVRWDEVKEIEASPYVFRIHLKDRSSIEIDFSQLTHRQYCELKPRLLELAQSKGVRVRAA
ncbi:MAG: hypothetical protein ONB12_04990 [candidate division KSB1 bacterium]|nr:hypothetical protein [candidate division KSB1 bacterium]